MKKIVIIGFGEVGKAIYKAEKKGGNKIKVIDTKEKIPKSQLEPYDTADVMHICIPYSNNFVSILTSYAKEYWPKLIIINSTVKVGTTQKVRDAIIKEHVKHIVHSPVRGVHPNLYEGVMKFTKYVGGDELANRAAVRHFKSLNIKAEKLGSYETSELMKIMSTSYYGWNILFAKECKIMCAHYGVDFDKVYTKPNNSYNEGYTGLGMKHVVRPVLTPPKGRIGGHCIGANYELLTSANATSSLRKIYQELDLK